MREMTKEFWEGFKAFDRGTNVFGDNPYRFEEDDREHDWEAGYYHAERLYTPNDWEHLQPQSVTSNFDSNYFNR